MSTFLLSIASGIAVGYLRGGRLRNLGSLRVPPGLIVVVWLALALQVAVRWIPPQLAGLDMRYALLIATDGAVAAALGFYLVTLLRTSSPSGVQAGVVLIVLGWLLNFAMIALNRGMPFSGSADGHSELFLKHVPMSSDTKLRFLGDVIYMAPFHEIVSAGDLVLALGLLLYVKAAMQAEPEIRSTPLMVVAGRRSRLPTR
jgi:Family of unknown function (DUF5317)